MRTFEADTHREWIETDGLGGFASGTVSTIRTRRYHALLLSAQRPPSDRWLLVNGIEAWLELEGESFALSSQRYPDGVTHPDGATRIAAFQAEPWPRWRYEAGGVSLEYEVCSVRDTPLTLLKWTARGAPTGARLFVRPLMSGRDPHQLQRASDDFSFGLSVHGFRLGFSSYSHVPKVHMATNGRYTHAPEWYRNFVYEEELARGLDHLEDLASPGVFAFDLHEGTAHLLMTTDEGALGAAAEPVPEVAARYWNAEHSRRQRHAAPLARAVESYVVKRGDNATVIAGYPWFGDWGRDTFIALRGVRLLPKGPEIAQSILREWAQVVSKGMLPNRFPDRGDEPEYNSVDASLWYVQAVRDHLTEPGSVSSQVRGELLEAVRKIVQGYRLGTRYNIQADPSGLLSAGVQGVQLTWMDAKVGDWVVTPRIGKPVEIQALWLNALDFARRHFDQFEETFQRGFDAFPSRFYCASVGYLKDVVDVEHQPNSDDGRLRPNQLLAVGGLPLSLVHGELARSIVDRIEANLWTPLGLRSLAPSEPNYVPHYQGGVRERDGAYHQGTVWPWLIGPFVDAWVKVRGGDANVQRQARRKFLVPLFEHLEDAGIGHVSEIADGASPHAPKGAPFQAWSVTELFRLDRTLAI